jgi:hypothetical protein
MAQNPQSVRPAVEGDRIHPLAETDPLSFCQVALWPTTLASETGNRMPRYRVLVAPVIALIGQPRTSQGHAPAMVADAGARQRGGQNGKRDEPCTRDSACFGRLGGHGGGAGCWSSRQGLTAATGMWYATRRLTIGCLERDMGSRDRKQPRRWPRPAQAGQIGGALQRVCGSQPTLSARENAGTAHPDQARRSTVVPPHRATTKGP